MKITKDIECPDCGDVLETEFETTETDLEVRCDECQVDIPFSYDEKSGVVTVLEYEDDEEEDDDEGEIVIGVEDEEEDEA